MELAKEAGARRAKQLPVSIASHSPLMSNMSGEFEEFVASISLNVPNVPTIANATARPLQTTEDVRREMVNQLTSPVRWIETVEYMVDQGVTEFIEVGPKDVLTGLLGRINKEVQGSTCGTVENVQALVSG
jgi:[acyl-carrier-protein] S-malonyltransferase